MELKTVKEELEEVFKKNDEVIKIFEKENKILREEYNLKIKEVKELKA